MGLKDKLGKAGKKAANQVDKTANNAVNTATDKVDDLFKTTSNTVSDGFDNLKTDVKETKKKAQKTSLFSKRKKSTEKTKKSDIVFKKTNTGGKTQQTSKDNSRIKLLIGLLSLVLLGLLAYAAMIFLNPASKEATGSTPTQQSQTVNAPTAVETDSDSSDTTVPTDTESNTAVTDTDTIQTNELNGVAEQPIDNAIAEVPSSLSETITAPLPTETTVAAEELDQLQDERDQMTEQEKLIQEQIEALEEMERLKAERIAILEKRLAEQASN